MNVEAWLGGGRITIREVHRPGVRDRRNTVITYEVILMDESKVRGVRLELDRMHMQRLANTCKEALEYGEYEGGAIPDEMGRYTVVKEASECRMAPDHPANTMSKGE